MNKMPCIRGLKEFKKGCPQKEWDGSEGCPCWKRLVVSSRENPLKKEIKEQCIDLWNFEFQWAGMGQREGIQEATESNRNMIALQSLIITGVNDSRELVNSAVKHLDSNQKLLIEEAKGN